MADIAADNPKRIGFWWLYGVLGFVFGTLAIVKLITLGFETGSLSAPAQLVIDAYDEAMRFLLGWAEPYLNAVLAYLGSLVGWELQLDSHWKHLFVLMIVFYGAFARILLNEGLYRFAAGIVLIGGLMTLIVSVLFAIAIPASGYMEINRFVVAIAIVVIGLAFFSIILGIVAAGKDREPGQTWWEALREERDTRLGLTVLGGFAGAGLFFAGNAGLKALGL